MGNDPTAKFIFSPPDMGAYPKVIRKIYLSAMQSSNLSKLTPKILERIDTVMREIDRSRRDGPVELKTLLTRMTLDVIGIMALDSNMGALDRSLEIHSLFVKVKYITMDNFKNPLLMKYCELVPWSKLARSRKHDIDALTTEYVKMAESILKRADPPKGEEPMWYALKTMKDPETGEPISFKTMVAELAVIILAGMDTTGQQLGWIFMLLASHPRVVEALLKELREHGLFGPDSREVTFDDLSDLSYLTAIIKEGMRIAYTLAVLPARQVPKDMTILGYRIPKGTVIMNPGMRAYSIEAEWGDPEIFRPERWLNGEELSNNYYMGFSFGPRDCIGQKLAMLEMRLTIVKLMRSYELKLQGEWLDVLNSAKDGIVIEAADGVWFNMTERAMD